MTRNRFFKGHRVFGNIHLLKFSFIHQNVKLMKYGANRLSGEFSRYSFNLSGVYQFYSVVILNILRNAKFMRSGGRKDFIAPWIANIFRS